VTAGEPHVVIGWPIGRNDRTWVAGAAPLPAEWRTVCGRAAEGFRGHLGRTVGPHALVLLTATRVVSALARSVEDAVRVSWGEDSGRAWRSRKGETIRVAAAGQHGRTRRTGRNARGDKAGHEGFRHAGFGSARRAWGSRPSSRWGLVDAPRSACCTMSKGLRRKNRFSTNSGPTVRSWMSTVNSSARGRIADPPDGRSSSMPPRSVRPATPVWPTNPPVFASPNAWVSRSSSPHSTPACTHRGARLWVHADALHQPQVDDDARVAYRVAWIAVSPAADGDQKADVTGEPDRGNHVGDAAAPRVSAGDRSMDPFQTRRCSSYVGSPG
jgi:hypothetical protein